MISFKKLSKINAYEYSMYNGSWIYCSENVKYYNVKFIKALHIRKYDEYDNVKDVLFPTMTSSKPEYFNGNVRQLSLVVFFPLQGEAHNFEATMKERKIIEKIWKSFTDTENLKKLKGIEIAEEIYSAYKDPNGEYARVGLQIARYELGIRKKHELI